MSIYEDYVRHDFVLAVQREIELRISGEMHEIMPQLLDFLRSTVRRVHSRFVESQDASGRRELPQTDDAGQVNDQWQVIFGEPFEQSIQQLVGEDASFEGNMSMFENDDSSISLLDRGFGISSTFDLNTIA